MAGTRTTIEKVNIEEQRNGDATYAAIKQFLTEGLEPDPEVLTDTELKIKVQRVTRSGQTQYGVALTANTFDNLVNRIIDECGPGNYNIFVEYKKLDGDRWKLAKGNNLKFVDPELVDNPIVYDSPRGENEKSSEVMELVKALIVSNTQMVNAAISGKNNPPAQQGSNLTDMISALQKLDELRAPLDDDGTEEEEPVVNPDDPYGLLQMASPVIAEILKKMVEAKTPEDGLQAQEELRKRILEQQHPPTQLPS